MLTTTNGWVESLVSNYHNSVLHSGVFQTFPQVGLYVCISPPPPLPVNITLSSTTHSQDEIVELDDDDDDEDDEG